MNDTYSFPGLWPFVERAAEGGGFTLRGESKAAWLVTQLQNSLGQLRGQDHAARLAAIEHVKHVHCTIRAMADGSAAAIAECCDQYGLPYPDWLEKETYKP